ncbi:MAG: glycerate kinase [Burkholderiaceae bacterium]|nr:glycerate kinase [Burkholderiaceae bacterium]MDO9089438.1 glycerate kinase [Burkholderiaceae bacterium]MDP1969021.1 glycerate kinase [Burkholderiaceae bacterium]
MKFQKILTLIFGILLIGGSYTAYGWAGIAVVSGGILMWVLLHFTRLMNVLKRASDRPIGYVGSAVMLNAKLKPGFTLMHVIAMVRALGLQLSPKDAQPEIYRWTDGSDSYVTCEFLNGKLVKWELVRPSAPAEAPAATPSQEPPQPVPPAP